MERKFLASLAVLVIVAATLDGAAGVGQLAVFALPFFAALALVLRGRFIGERHIVRRWQRLVPRTRVRTRNRWPVAPTVTPVTWHDRFARPERGPPALAAR